MPIYKAHVVIPADSAVPADVVVNNFGFSVVGDEAAARASIKTALAAFYNAWATHRSVLYVWDQARLKFYDMGAPKPRVPLSDELLGLSSTAGTTSLPQEVSLCMSFQAERTSGQNQRRRRGRVYLGPFVTNAVQGTTGRPDATFQGAIVAAAQALLNTSGTESSWAWAVISEATGTPTVSVVHDGWVDNAFDTQRRRGPDPTSRTVFTAAA